MLSILKRIFVMTPFIIVILAVVSFVGWAVYEFYKCIIVILDYHDIPHYFLWVTLGFITWFIAASILFQRWR